MRLPSSLQLFLRCRLLHCLSASLPAPSHALLFRQDGNVQRLRIDAPQRDAATVFVPSRPLQCAATAFVQPAEGLAAIRPAGVTQKDVTLRLGKQQYITPFSFKPTGCPADDSASAMYVEGEGCGNSSSTGGSSCNHAAPVSSGSADERVPMAVNPSALDSAAGFTMPEEEEDMQVVDPPLLPLPQPQPTSEFSPDPAPSLQQHSFQPNTAGQSAKKEVVRKPAPKARPPPPPVALKVPAPSLTPATELFPICNMKGKRGACGVAWGMDNGMGVEPSGCFPLQGWSEIGL